MLAFEEGRPFKKAIYTNVIFLISLALVEATNLYMTLHDALWSDSLFGVI
jgi:hypothetical protein